MYGVVYTKKFHYLKFIYTMFLLFSLKLLESEIYMEVSSYILRQIFYMSFQSC
jgi:hypothetical protein